MDIEKQKQIYELIEKDLQRLADKKSELVKEIEEEKKDLYKSLIWNSIIYEHTYYYKQLLPIIASIVKKIGLPSNSISYSQVIENLIFDGYLSSDTELTPYKVKDKDDIEPLDLFGFFGIDVIRREGICRHFASIHQDIFHKLHLFHDIFAYYSWHSNKPFEPPIEANYGFLKEIMLPVY